MSTPSYQDLMRFVDLTCLKDETQSAEITELAQTAVLYQTAAVCLWPKDLARLPLDFKISKATVVNFPHGTEKTIDIQKQIDAILQQFPQTEIDYVFPYLRYWSDQKKSALQACQDIREHCHAHGVKFKVILESGYQAFPSKLFDFARDVLETQPDFLKTSTGKIAQGASLEAVDVICRAILSQGYASGIKVSGGIRHYRLLLEYFKLISSHFDRDPSPDWLRFGTSHLHHD